MTALSLNVEAITTLTPERFWQLCQTNRDLQLELTAQGHLVIMPPTGWGSGRRNASLTTRLTVWAEADGTGITFDSSTGFRLPNGAIRSPDAAWVRQDRLAALNPNPEEFLPLAPDFVVELRSASDGLKPLQLKMQEYIENDVRLGWLLNAKDREVEIYRPGQAVEILSAPQQLSGEDVLPRFVLELAGIWG
jgi:Uma2 family endonuclease